MANCVIVLQILLILAIPSLALNSTILQYVQSSYFGGNGSTTLVNVFFDSKNFYFAGYTTTRDFDAPAGVIVQEFGTAGSTASNDFVVGKGDLNGTLLWVTFLGGSSADMLTSMAVANDGSIYVTGNTQSTDFPPSGAPYNSIVVCHLLDSGVLDFTKSFSGNDQSYPLSIAIVKRPGESTDAIWMLARTRATNFVFLNGNCTVNTGVVNYYVAQYSMDFTTTYFSRCMQRQEYTNDLQRIVVDQTSSAILYFYWRSTNTTINWSKIYANGTIITPANLIKRNGDQFLLATDSLGNTYVRGASAVLNTCNGTSFLVSKIDSNLVVTSKCLYAITQSAEGAMAVSDSRDIYFAFRMYNWNNFPLINAFSSSQYLGSIQVFSWPEARLRFSSMISTFPNYPGINDAVRSAHYNANTSQILFVGAVSTNYNLPLHQPFQNNFTGTFDGFFLRFDVKTGPSLASNSSTSAGTDGTSDGTSSTSESAEDGADSTSWSTSGINTSANSGITGDVTSSDESDDAIVSEDAANQMIFNFAVAVVIIVCII